MLAILDPKLDRHTLDRRSTFLTAAVVALLVLPLAALRPFEQPGAPAALTSVATAKPDAKASPQPGATANYTCDSADLDRRSQGTSTHISVHDEPELGSQILRYMVTTPGRCAEAAVFGLPKFNGDETRLLSLPPEGLARFRERLPGNDRMVVGAPGEDGVVTYIARVNDKRVFFDSAMSNWLAGLIPEVMREAGVNVPQRVARLRREGGVGGVLRGIAGIRSTLSKTAHYKALLETDDFTQSQIDAIARSVGEQLASSPSDLRAVLDLMLPQRASARRRGTSGSESSAPVARAAYPSAAATASIGEHILSAVRKAQSSGDKASLLTQYAFGGDPEAVLMALRGVKEVSSSGDKASVLRTLVAPALSRNRADLRRAFFDAYRTIPSDGDSKSVLIAAIPYGHTNSAVTVEVLEATLNIASSGDKSQVLIAVAQQRLLTSPAVREAYLKAAKQISSSGDYARVLQAAIQQ